MTTAVDGAVAELGRLDVIVANAESTRPAHRPGSSIRCSGSEL